VGAYRLTLQMSGLDVWIYALLYLGIMGKSSFPDRFYKTYLANEDRYYFVSIVSMKKCVMV
jgi:hypothetical protein